MTETPPDSTGVEHLNALFEKVFRDVHERTLPAAKALMEAAERGPSVRWCLRRMVRAARRGNW